MLKKLVLAILLMGGGSSSLFAQGNQFCPTNNTVTLTCNNVVMEALWVRLGNDMNTLASTTDGLLIQALSNDGFETIIRILVQFGNRNPSVILEPAFQFWWNSYITFQNNPNPINTGAYSTATNLLIDQLIRYYQGFLSQDDQLKFNRTVDFYMNQLVNDSISAVLSFGVATPSSYAQGINFSAHILKDTAFIGVYLDKSLSGTVP